MPIVYLIKRKLQNSDFYGFLDHDNIQPTERILMKIHKDEECHIIVEDRGINKGGQFSGQPPPPPRESCKKEEESENRGGDCQKSYFKSYTWGRQAKISVGSGQKISEMNTLEFGRQSPLPLNVKKVGEKREIEWGILSIFHTFYSLWGRGEAHGKR